MNYRKIKAVMILALSLSILISPFSLKVLAADNIYFNGKEIAQVSTLNIDNSAYHKVTGVGDINKIVAELANIVNRSDKEGDSGVLLNLKDGSRESIVFYKKDYPYLSKLCDLNNEKTNGNIQWLSFMDTNKITNIKFEGMSSKFNEFSVINTADKKAITEIANHLKSMEIVGDAKVYTVLLNPTTPASAYSLDITFNTGVKYYINGYDGSAYIISNDIKNKTIWYKVSEKSTDTLRDICERIDKNNAYQKNPIAEREKSVNIYNDNTKTYVKLDYIYNYLDTLTAMSKEKLGSPLTGFNRIEVVDYKDKTFIYNLYQNGFTVEGSGVAGINPADAYTLHDYSGFKTFLLNATKDQDNSPYWLGIMNDSNIESVLFKGSGEANQSQATAIKDPTLSNAVDELRNISVKTPATVIPKYGVGTPYDATSIYIFINFKNDITYTIDLSSKDVHIYSSDMTYSLFYDTADNKSYEAIYKILF